MVTCFESAEWVWVRESKVRESGATGVWWKFTKRLTGSSLNNYNYNHKTHTHLPAHLHIWTSGAKSRFGRTSAVSICFSMREKLKVWIGVFCIHIMFIVFHVYFISGWFKIHILFVRVSLCSRLFGATAQFVICYWYAMTVQTHLEL